MSESLITLEAELHYTEYYLDIQKLRFGERLSFHIDIDDTLQTALIPPFLVQTLVENAFKHAFEKQGGPSSLTITARDQGNHISLCVWNSAVHDEKAVITGKRGHGLANMDKRLRLLFPNDFPKIALTHFEHGTNVEVNWPRIYDI
jgi:two-component system, LytTR family, sensor histidine kinase AlgZ